MKRIAIWAGTIVILLLAVAGMIWAVKNSNNTESGDLAVPVSASDQMKGNPESRVTLVEYSDFQCPACKSYYPIVEKLMDEYGSKIRFVYRHFPLPQHKNARPTAFAAEAAGRQGKFWEMVNEIFNHQDEWALLADPKDTLLSYADEIGLDKEKFLQDFDSNDVREKVEDDLQGGVRSRVRATPTFFLNGAAISNPRSYDEFKRAIDAAITQAP
ncbi:MAG: hypothetical protein UY61_C0007G0001 [Candidatus Adlerbacteria bacterium GW2011_GWC1_50_9]|uniref:Thioredoxin domain-containing protein n=2 Tax=Parcubacteria group TaxID=1794811 RepID=A0A0G1Z221_9BACT|nr:MAG: hypothetical protein UY61_C0007G0001 [Candidatus Adlerbacteria bacterium GW2011_GWC1_50_9]KKW29696.1 MAG: hypothetical protein UY74_C0066G0005 [Candidatus Kaiserbacteria bacterium GW2011_GWC2_52_8b]